MNIIKKYFAPVVWLVSVVAFFWGALAYASYRDSVNEKESQVYESCVREQYHTSPAAWYSQYGELPNCY